MKVSAEASKKIPRAIAIILILHFGISPMADKLSNESQKKSEVKINGN